MMFACRSWVCGIAYCDEFCQRKDYVSQYKGKCTFQVLRKTKSAKCLPDDVVKQICRFTLEKRVPFFDDDDDD